MYYELRRFQNRSSKIPRIKFEGTVHSGLIFLYASITASITTAQWVLCCSPRFIIIHSFVWSSLMWMPRVRAVVRWRFPWIIKCVLRRESGRSQALMWEKYLLSGEKTLCVSVPMSIKYSIQPHFTPHLQQTNYEKPNDEDEMRSGNCRCFVASGLKVLEQSHRKKCVAFVLRHAEDFGTHTAHSSHITRLLNFDKWGAFVLKNPFHSSHRILSRWYE